MTIQSQNKRIAYAGNGVTSSFAYNWRILDQANLKVVVQSAAGVDSVKTITTHYTVTGVGDDLGGNVVMLTAPASGETISIILDPELTQTTDYTTGGAFPAESHEDGLDKSTNINKRTRDLVERSLSLQDGDVDGSGVYNANSNRITNLGTPTASTDAATKASVDAAISSAQLAPATDVITALGTGYTIADYRYQIADTGSSDVDLDTRLSETKSVTDFGATGDGSTDDTAAVQAACDSGGWIFFPPGTYMLDEVTITDEVHLVLDPSAILKQRSITASTDQAILKFAAGSDYSTVEGGQFDGNASALTGTHTDEVMTAIRVIGAPDHIRVARTYIHDFLYPGWYFGSGGYSVFEDIHVKDCGKGCIHQQANNGLIQNVTFEGISNNGKAIYQHGVEIRDAENFSIHNVRMIDFAPDNSGLEPTPTAFTFERMDRMEASALVATGFTGVTKPGMGFVFDTLSLSNVRGMSIDRGYDQGMAVQTCTDSALDGLQCDLEYNTAGNGIGVRVRTGGLYPPVDAGAVSENARANEACRNLKISNSLVMCAEVDGYAIQSGGVTLTHCVALGCDNNGFRIDEDLANSLFAGAPIPISGDVILDACVAQYNGSSGLLIDKGQDISVRGGSYSNNGQDSSLGTNLRCGILLTDVDRATIVDVTVADTQSWSTKTNGASFQPGATSGDQYEVSLIDPGLINVGQYVSLRDAGGAGVHATAKVVAKDRDEITVEVSGGFTFSASGNLTSLTGTFATSDFTLTGTGSALDTEVTGRTWLENGGNYRRGIRVNSATSGIIESGYPSDLSGATLQKLQVDVQPIASQQVGIRVESTVTELYCSGVTGSGNASLLYSVGSAASIRSIERSSGARVDVASAGTIAIPYGAEFVQVTGTTGMTTITAGFNGQEVKLFFAGSLTVADGSNLNLAGNFSATAGDVLHLVCDGTNWNEISRSAN